MTIRPELIDELLKDCSNPREVLVEGVLLKQLTKAIIECCLETELDAHLGYPKHGRREEGRSNARNGSSRKTLKGAQGESEIAVPRDRQASFEPQLIQKHQTHLEGFEDKILALYARGMTTRDIQAQVQDLYGVEVSPTFISNITEAVMEEVRQWQTRPLDAVYPIVYGDCLVVKVRENQRVLNKALYLALGVELEGQKELLGMWMSQSGARGPNSGSPSSPNCKPAASRISSSLVWMDSPVFQKPWRRSIRRPASNSVWCIWCATRSNMSPTNIVRRWLPT